MLFGKLDRYMARSFVEPFLVATAVIVGLYVVGDAFGNLDNYLREADGFFVALGRMAKIYALRVPFFLSLILPISMLVGAAYGISQLSARNEIMAMKASGVSFWRVLGPVYAMAILIAALSMANREMLVPVTEQVVAPEMMAWEGKTDEADQRVVGHIEEEFTQYTMVYNVTTGRAKHLWVFKDPPGGPMADFLAAEAEPAKGGWRLSGVQVDSGEAPGDFWGTSLRRRDVELRLLPPESRPIKLLRRSIRYAGSDRERAEYVLYYHMRLAYPFMGIVLVALGVPFVIGHERVQRSRMLGIGVCVGICMVYYTVQFVAKDLGLGGRLPPAVAAWLPNVIFAGLGIYLLDHVHN
jgi:LPS export ABC transporter permease LptG